jgi:DNA-binding SARP family transcriptional activator
MAKRKDEASPLETPEHRYELRLVGAPTLSVPSLSEALPLDPSKAALLAYLAVEGACQPKRLNDVIWTSAASDPTSNVRNARSTLRAKFGIRCVEGKELLYLDPKIRHDVDLLVRPRQGGTSPATSLVDTLAPCDGPFLGHHDYSDRPRLQAWVQAQRARWQALLRASRHDEVQRLELSGQLDAATVLAERMVLDDPYAEDAYHRVASLHWRRGDRVNTRAVLSRARAMLTRAGVEAFGQRLVDLEAQVERKGSIAPSRLVTSRPVGPFRSAGRMVGRVDEWKAIRRVWRAGIVVLVEGEEGVGKTRLISEFANAEPPALLVPAAPGDSADGYSFLVRVLRGVLSVAMPHCPPWVLKQLARLMPEVGPADEHPTYLPPLQEAIREALILGAKHGISGLVLDDVQWADSPSLELLLQCFDRLGTLAPPLLLACRTGERPAALSDHAKHARREMHVVALNGLKLPDLREFLRAQGMSERASMAWAAALEQRTLGNPLQVVNWLTAISERDGVEALLEDVPDVDNWPAPPSLEQNARRRLGPLSEQARSLAIVAALVNSNFSARLAEKVLQLPLLSLAPAWSELEAVDVLRDTRLSHAVFGQILVADLPASIAREIHARIAASAQELEFFPGIVAYHWYRAERYEAAAAAFEASGARAMSLNLLAEALSHWDLAVQCHDAVGDGDRAFAARLSALDASLLVEPSDKSLTRARDIMALALREDQRLAAWVGLALVHESRDDVEEWVETADAIVAAHRSTDGLHLASGASKWHLRGLLTSAAGYSFAGRHAEALRLLQDVDPAIRGIADAGIRLQFLEALGAAQFRAGELKNSSRTFEESLALAEEVQNWSAAMIACNNLAVAKARQGDYRAALALVERGKHWRERMEGPLDGVFMWANALAAGMFEVQLGRYAQGLEHLRYAIENFRAGGAIRRVVDGESHLGRALLYLGQRQLANELLDTPTEGKSPSTLIRAIVRQMVDHWAGINVADAVRGLIDDYPEVMEESRLALQLMLARALNREEAVGLARDILSRATSMGQSALAQHARVVLALGLLTLQTAKGNQEAAAVMDEVIGCIDRCQPLGMYFGETWWVAHRAFAAAGFTDRAQDALDKGRQWVMEEVLPHVPDDYREGFLRDNPVNRELLSTCERLRP